MATARVVVTVIQNTRRPILFQFVSDGVSNFTGVTAAVARVLRGDGSSETWDLTVSGTPTATLWAGTYSPPASGVGSFTTANETIYGRGVASFSGGSANDLQMAPEFQITVTPEVGP